MLFMQCLLAVPIFRINLFLTPFIQAALRMPIAYDDLPNYSSFNRWYFCKNKKSQL